ncbi:MAG: selenium-dependent molybdenum cofactor biosynthesis protein YqeB [Candidatus Promineifilaceae bacterium]|nr:selenium-dependent molybdenum cofactor biosynthesis protein YqeB [Candidatus Promineifilaceae bacterium]
MDFSQTLVLLRGGGDLATGVAYRLHQAGFPLIVLELAKPLVVRRRVALATAVTEGEVHIENLHGCLVESPRAALALAGQGVIPVLVAAKLPEWPTLPPKGPLSGPLSADRYAARWSQCGHPAAAIVDARMAKKNIDTAIDQADHVIALGPGFTAGHDCHAVIETMRGHRLGRVIWQGEAQANTGTPGEIAGKGAERVLRSPCAGPVSWRYEIGDRVTAGALLGTVGDQTVKAPFAGVLRGLIAPGTIVRKGLKIGDLDARNDREACFTISDKALAVGGGVLEALLVRLRKLG